MRVAGRVDVELGSRSYPVLIGSGLLEEAGTHLGPFARSGKLAIVSDRPVWEAQGERLRLGLERFGIEAVPVFVPEREDAKSWDSLVDLTDRLLALELGRGDYVVAFGGGAVGDVAGFAAAILKRGCGYIQVPTTLLAQVDSSVGGKTGINTAAGKNMVGAFHQPALVMIDPSVLATLPARQLRAGYAEVVKYGLLGDLAFFEWCEANGGALVAGAEEARHHAIFASVTAKAKIVSGDERDTAGQRALLNLGHTFGHALEAETGFSDRLLHGEAVALGTVLAFRLSARLGLCAPGDAERVAAHFRAVGLPTRFDADPANLIHHMRQDKKAVDGRVTFILLHGIGRAFVARDMDLGMIEAFLQAERVA